MMIIYKCFFRKKTTKIAILLLTLSFLILSILILGKSKYINKTNDCYKGSFLEINNVDNNDIRMVKRNISVDNYEIGFTIDDYYFLVGSKSLSKNEIILPIQLIEEYKVGDRIELELNDNVYNFVIKNFENKSYYRFVVSELLYDELALNKSKVLRIDVKNWADRENIAKKLEKKLKKDVGTFTVKKDDMNYDIVINVFSIVISLFILLFSILFVITIYNLIIDEGKTNLILRNVGYSKNKLLILTIKKIFLILSVSFIINFVIFLLFSFVKVIVL